MIQYPIDFYPDGHTFDPTFYSSQNNNKISFTFKGDVLLSYHWKIYDYDTEELVSANYKVSGNSGTLTPLSYNNGSISIENAFVNTETFTTDKERRYVIQLLLTQGTSDENLIYDRFVLRGELVNAYDHSVDINNMTIEDKINMIYEWNVDSQNVRRPVTINRGTDILLGGIIMQIGNEQRIITSYNYVTGAITLDSAFENDYPAGEPYQLYSNYLITQQYFFKTIPFPEITNLAVDWAGDVGSTRTVGVGVTADYALNAYNPIKYYTVVMEKQVGEDIINQPRHYVKIYETEKRYSQRISVAFTDDYDVYDEHGELPEGNNETRRYLFTINAVLQNGMTISASIDSQAPERNDSIPITHVDLKWGNVSNQYNAVRITWIHAQEFAVAGGVRIYRYDMNAEDILHSRVLLASVLALDDIFVDTTISTHGKYKYVLIPFTKAGTNFGVSYTPVITDTFTTDMYGYTITELIYNSSDGSGKTAYLNGRASYKLGESWHLRADVEDTTITQNTDKTLHVGYGRYSSVTHTTTNYLSGTFNGAIVQPNCGGEVEWRDDIELVKAWREFITRDCIYLLRSQKGDVLVVNVVENPTTTYEEKYKPIPTSVSFNWAECEDINNIMVISGNEW